MSNSVIRSLTKRKKDTGFVNIPVTQIHAEPNVGSISVRFDPAPQGVSVRELQVSTDGVSFTTLASTLQGNMNLYDTAFEHRGLDNKTTRYYRLRNGVSGTSVTWGNFSGIKGATTIALPTGNNGFGSARLISAEIDGTNGRTDEIILTFDENVILPNTQGWHLADGPCDFVSVVSGSGTNRVVCKLSDYIIPDHEYRVIHRREISGATSSTGKLNNQGYISVVKKNVNQYLGTGVIYYVAANGNDANSGLKSNQPKRTVDSAMALAGAGDYVLTRCGDTFVTNPRFARNGTAQKYIWLSYYGNGDKPRIIARDPEKGEPWHNKPVIEFTRSYNAVCGLYLEVKGGGACVNYLGSAHCITKGCIIRGNATLGICPAAKNSGAVYPIILDNDVRDFWACIRSSGYKLETEDGTVNGKKRHQVHGGLIEGNFCYGGTDDDYALQRGDYHNIVFRYNIAEWWYDDGLDLFSSDNIIAEYNIFRNVRPDVNNCAMKLGGLTGSDIVKNVSGKNIIARYNKIYDVRHTKDQHGINTNNGRGGEIYGNFIINGTGSGIKLSGTVEGWKIYNNTVINCRRGLDSFEVSGNSDNVHIWNNIFEGSNRDIQVDNPKGGNHIGRNNILVNGTISGGYSGTDDILGANVDLLFVNYTGNKNGDYRLPENSPAVDYGISVDGYNKDNQGLSITNGIDCGCFERVATDTVENTTFFYCGDSLTDNDTSGQDGYAEHISKYFGAYVTHRNMGNNGESTSSYRYGRDEPGIFWPDFEHEIKEGDWVFLAHGHNDRWSSTKSTSEAEFQANLIWFVQQIRDKGANPVLCTPFERRQFTSPTQVNDSHGNYDDIVRTVAADEGVILLDLQARTKEVFEQIGQTKADYYWGDPAYPEEEISGRPDDRTHANSRNAFRLALTLVHEIVRQDLFIKNYLLLQYKSFTLDSLSYPDIGDGPDYFGPYFGDYFG